MAIDTQALGRTFPPHAYTVGREKIREYARAVGETNQLHLDLDAARAAGHADVVAPPMFAVVDCASAIDQALFDPEVGIDFAMVVHGGQEFGWGALVIAGDEMTTRSCTEISERVGMAFRVRDGFGQPAARVCTRDLDQDRQAAAVSELAPGDELPTQRVTPDRDATARYAGASGTSTRSTSTTSSPHRRASGPDPARPVHDGAARTGPDRRRSAVRTARAAHGPVPRCRTAGTRDRGRTVVTARSDGRPIVNVTAQRRGRRSQRDGRADALSRGHGTAAIRRSAPPRPAAPTIKTDAHCRQETILRSVVDGYAATGRPVGSKALAGDPNFEWGSVDDPPRARQPRGAGACSRTRTRPPAASRPRPGTATSSTACCPFEPPGPAALVCRSCAVSSTRRCGSRLRRYRRSQTSWRSSTAPPIETSTIRHIEVLTLQPQVLMVVVITSTGGVSKRLFTFARPVDPGLVTTGPASYLNERSSGSGSARGCCTSVSHDPAHCPNRAFVPRPRCRRSSPSSRSQLEASLYVDGTARLLTVGRFGEVPPSSTC